MRFADLTGSIGLEFLTFNFVPFLGDLRASARNAVSAVCLI
jgi:hypothetical protein